MNILRPAFTCTFVLLASLAGCTQESADTGSSTSAVEPSDAAKPPLRPILADVVPLGEDGKPDLAGAHVLVPFVLPPPPTEGADESAPPPCEIHRASAEDPLPPKPDDAPPKDGDALPPPPADAKLGPLALQIAFFTGEERPAVVIQCAAKPGETITVPRATIEDALSGLSSPKARLILAAFPPPPAKDVDAAERRPPMGRGVYSDVEAVTDASSLEAPLAGLSLEAPSSKP
jgi:hypothetical protein